ncbi:hypothetical protein AJ79_07535 [Helicocarpus griseus UAMH5409]|uniref:Peptidase A1 domain-containing protein n=1 Tax=Helicocarpus griseus UAMH5409 TaxID=1447875 RepID=A0A2B7X1Q4_9EURO|nr:hypothetical protein AJ79_07535 [Helicocarpus griseus UAMH5409]
MLYASVLSLSWLLIHGSQAQECSTSAPTIEIPIGNYSIGNDADAEVRWGLGLEVGTPPQKVVAAINGDWNNTWFWGSEQECPKTQPTGNCHWFRGNVFDAAKSDSFVDAENTDVYDFRSNNNKDWVVGAWGNDTISLKPDTTIEQLPLYTPKAGTPPQGSIGLGRASTFLNALKSQKKIASRSWSLFWGWQGLEAANQMNGNLVFGGYDKAKAKGANYTKELGDVKECSSGMVVFVKSIQITTWYGDKNSVFDDAGTALKMCIRPDFPPISLPEPVFYDFIGRLPGKYLGPANGIYDDSIVHNDDPPFKGNLSFELDSGLVITVPNHQLILPNVELSSDGKQEILNNSRIIPVHNAGRTGVPFLGQAFLSSAYLHVNDDLKKFSIWEANPTKDTDIVGVAEGSCGDNPVTNPSSPSKDSSNGLSGGAIAGIVIGVVAGVALIGLAVWFFFLRKPDQEDREAQRSSAHAQALLNTDTKKRVPELDDTGFSNPGVTEHYKPVNELPSPSDSQPQYNIPRGPMAELPAGNPHTGGNYL